MALRFCRKISSRNFQNLGKLLHTKKIEPIVTIQQLNEESSKSKLNNKDIGKTSVYPPHLNNFQQQTTLTGVKRLDTEAKILQQNLHINELQPSMLPEYYQPPINVSDAIFPKPLETPSKYRHFEKSPTYKNVKLPLKKPRLANPFPDPIKAMPSDTTSDQEKADQMQSSVRLPEGQSWGGFSQYRSYSISAGDDARCKSPRPEFVLKECPPRSRNCCINNFPVSN